MDHQRHSAADSKPGSRKSIFSSVWTAWKGLGRIVGDMIARVALSLFYFTLFVPFAVGVRLFGDPLAMKARLGSSHWLQRSTGDLSLQDSRRQF
jgi:hypothetical protein